MESYRIENDNGCENHNRALNALKSCGLVLDSANTSPVSSPAISTPSNTDFAHFLLENLLNFGLREQAPCGHSFKLILHNGISIPARSHLLLQHISEHLHITIFLFSSRGKPLKFAQDSAIGFIGLYYHVDSYLGIGEFFILKTDPYATKVDRHIHNSAMEQGSESSGAPAVFRTEELKPNRKRRAQELDESDCVSAFKRACIMSITNSVNKALPASKSKKRTRGRKALPDNSTIKEELRTELSGRDSIPRGVMPNTLAFLKEQCEDEGAITKGRVEWKLKDPTPLSRFKDYVKDDFDVIWDNAVEEQEEREQAAAQKRQNGKGKEENTRQVEIDDEEVESGHESKDLRTCTATLKHIARLDMSDMSDNLSEFVSIAKSRQREVTGALREVAALAQRTTLLAAGGDLYGPELDVEPNVSRL
ncbi:hypothetical protein BGX34_009440 [Mortierella sp. NVP85]|nr:hypothetical protein BGX34_009440 [Mortierella sp. NVP85]